MALTLIGADSVPFGADGVALGVADSYAPYAPAIPYAQDFITAAGITNATQQQAVRQLVADLLAIGVLNRYSRADSRLKVWYPVVGGTAAAHKLNLIDPSAYATTFYNKKDTTSQLVHSDLRGIEFDGDHYGDTGFTLDALGGETNGGALLYYSFDNDLPNIGFEMGALGGAGAGGILMLTLQDESNQALSYSGQPLTYAATPITDSRGLFAASFDAQSQTIGTYRNGSLISALNPSNGAHPLLPCLVGTFSLNGEPFSKCTRRRCGGFGIATGFPPAQHAAFYTAVQRFNTTLGRAV